MVVLVQYGQVENLQKDFVGDKMGRGERENIFGGQNVATGMAILVNRNLLWVNMLIAYKILHIDWNQD